MRLYVKPKTRAEAGLLEVLRMYGIPPVLEKDKRGPYYDVTPPDYWTSYRKEKFKKAIDQVPKR